MAIITMPATTPPTMEPVLLLLEGDAVDEDEEVVDFGADVVEAGNPVADGACVVVVVREGEEELEAPINAPGPISGLSEERRCEDDGEKKAEKNSYCRRTSIYSHPNYSPADAYCQFMSRNISRNVL